VAHNAGFKKTKRSGGDHAKKSNRQKRSVEPQSLIAPPCRRKDPDKQDGIAKSPPVPTRAATIWTKKRKTNLVCEKAALVRLGAAATPLRINGERVAEER